MSAVIVMTATMKSLFLLKEPVSKGSVHRQLLVRTGVSRLCNNKIITTEAIRATASYKEGRQSRLNGEPRGPSLVSLAEFQQSVGQPYITCNGLPFSAFHTPHEIHTLKSLVCHPRITRSSGVPASTQHHAHSTLSRSLPPHPTVPWATGSYNRVDGTAARGEPGSRPESP